VKAVTFHPYGEKGLHSVCFIAALVCRPAGKITSLAPVQPCHFRHQLLANTQRARGGASPGSQSCCLPDRGRVRERAAWRSEHPESGPGTQERNRLRPSRHRGASQGQLCTAFPAGSRSPWLRWRASATLCTAAAMPPTPPQLALGGGDRRTGGTRRQKRWVTSWLQGPPCPLRGRGSEWQSQRGTGTMG